MQFLQILTLAVSVVAVAIEPRHHKCKDKTTSAVAGSETVSLDGKARDGLLTLTRSRALP